MLKITEKIFKIDNLKLSSMFLIIEKDGLTFVDAGTAEDLDEIKRQMENAGLKFGEVTRIIITHAHMDHIGTLQALGELTDADVYVNGGDYGRIKDKVSSARLHKTNDKDKIGSAECIHIPGHTDGSMALYFEEGRVLLSGDSLFNINGLSLSPEKYCKDFSEYKKNVVKLLNYSVDILCTSHGPHISKSCNQRIKDVIESSI